MAGPSRTRPRIALTCALALLVALSGCGFFGGGTSPSGPPGSDGGGDATVGGSAGTDSTASGEADSAGSDDGSTDGASDGTDSNADGTETFTGERARQIEAATGNQTAAVTDAGSFTVLVDSRTTSPERAIITNQTIRVDVSAGRLQGETTKRFVGDANYTIETGLFWDGSGVYLRQGFADVSSYTYEYRNRSSIPDVADPIGIDSRFDFERSTTESGDTVLTVDSLDQVAGSGGGFLGDSSEIRNVSVRIVVDDRTGIVTSLRYHIAVVADGGGTIVHDVNRRVVGVGETTVSPPAWLSEARQRVER